MKRFSILMVLTALALILTGCTKLQFETGNGMKATYNRYIMGQQITKLTVAPNQDGSVTIALEGMKSDAQAVTDVLSTAIAKIPGAP